MGSGDRGSGKLTFSELFSIGVGGMIGGGIFAVLGLSLQLSDSASPVAFLVAGFVALLTAYSYAKLSRRFPSSGGTVEFLVQAYGDGVVSGGFNIMLLVAYTVMIALYAFAFGSYGASVVGGAKAVYVALVVFVIGFFTFVNLLGAKTSGRVELALVGFKLAVLLFVSLGGLLFVDWARLSPSHWPEPTKIIVGGMIIFLAYEGFELISNAAADAKSTRDLEKAFYASVITVIAVYVLVAIVSAGLLTAAQVIKYRDYALAVVAEKIVGRPGFYFVVAAALASTGSAINATLYGNARISYIVAKYGQAPEIFERRVWKGGYEGLIIIAVISLALALGATLGEISTAGSSSFLLIFAMVNLAAYRLRHKTGASPIVTLMGALLSIISLAILLWHQYQQDPKAVLLFAVLAAGSFAVEALYRKATGRKLPKYVDKRLEEREHLIHNWHSWVPRLVKELRKTLGEIEVYLVGSLARRELHRSHDVDILLVIPPGSSREETERLVAEAMRKAGITEKHPLDIHLVTENEKEEALRKSRKYEKL